MFYAFRILKTDGGSISVPVREHGYKNLINAIKALDKFDSLGYIKQYGRGVPVYHKGFHNEIQ